MPKIHSLPEVTDPDPDDELAIVRDPAGTPVTVVSLLPIWQHRVQLVLLDLLARRVLLDLLDQQGRREQLERLGPLVLLGLKDLKDQKVPQVQREQPELQERLEQLVQLDHRVLRVIQGRATPLHQLLSFSASDWELQLILLPSSRSMDNTIPL